ncbi:hypothetical protein D3C76_523410 [compost metagenome]
MGDAALGGDKQREKGGEGNEHPLGQFPQAEPRGEQRHPGENGDLTDGGEGWAEHAFTGARQSQQQPQGKPEPAAEQQPAKGSAQAQGHATKQCAVEQTIPSGLQDGQRADQNVRVNPLLIRGQLPQRQKRQWQQPRLQALPALITRPATDFGGGGVRPVHQFPVQQTDAAIHRHTDQADHHNAHEHDVEHEQLPGPDHQVADAFTGSEQFNSEQ